MQGVEILTSSQVVTDWTINWPAFWIIMIGVMAVFIVWGIIGAIDEGTISFLGFVMIVGVFASLAISMIVGGLLCQAPASYETQYKVTISDEVSMTEFYEHYEVIEQDGKIFTVREKTNEE